MRNKNKEIIPTITTELKSSDTLETVTGEAYKRLQEITDQQKQIFAPLLNTRLYSFTERLQNGPIVQLSEKMRKKWNALNDTIEIINKDREICENNNAWYNLTIDELEAEKEKTKHLESKLKEQGKILKKIEKLANNYFTPTQRKEKQVLASTDPTNEIDYFRIILKPILQKLFEPTNLYQWECFLKAETPPIPIETKKGVTLKDLRYFLDKLVTYGIIKSRYLSILTSNDIIYHNGKPLTYNNLINARREINKRFPKNAPFINDFFDKLD